MRDGMGNSDSELTDSRLQVVADTMSWHNGRFASGAKGRKFESYRAYQLHLFESASSLPAPISNLVLKPENVSKLYQNPVMRAPLYQNSSLARWSCG